MTKVEFPCGHSNDSFRIEFAPVLATGLVYLTGRQKSSYIVEHIDLASTIGEEDLRKHIFSESKKNSLAAVQAICPSCGEKTSCTKLKTVITCATCSNKEDLIYCKHRDASFCKTCLQSHCGTCKIEHKSKEKK